MDTPDHQMSGHVIVCGVHGLGVRVLELLQSAGIEVIAVGIPSEDHHARSLRAIGVPMLAGSPRNPDLLEQAGIRRAIAVVCVEDDDLKCLESALLARELAPDVRVILRQSNPAVGRAVGTVIEHGLVVNPADLAAPTFTESVLDERMHRMPMGGADYLVREIEVTSSGRLRDMFGDLAPILVMHADGRRSICPSRDLQVVAGDQVALVGEEEELADVRDMPGVALGRSAQRRRQRRRPVHALARNLAYGANSGLKWTVFALVLVGVVFTMILTIGFVDTPGDNMDLLDAVYFSVETIATVGYGDFALDTQPAQLRIAAIVVMILATVLLAVFYALVTEFLVSRRIAATFGLARVTGMSDHIIVVGLGSLGLAVVERLVAMGQQVVVVERNSNNRHIGRARALGVPVIAQDATQEETLLSANLPAAQGVAVLTSDEYSNLETGLAVRDALGDRAPEVPLVMRVFDRRLGAMLEQRLHFHHVRSVSAVSAPWFVAAALGLEVIATFAVDQEPFIAGRLTVRADGGLAGASMLDLPMRARVVALVQKQGVEHLPRGKTTLKAGDDVFVVGPPEDLLLLLVRNRVAQSVES